MKAFVLFTLLLSVSSFASTLDDIIQSTWQSDPLITSQERRIKAAELDQFARFLPNNPTVNYTSADNYSWRTYGASLVIGLPGKAFALKKVDNEIARAEKNEMYAKRIELAAFILSIYGDCASNKELISILSTAVRELAVLKDAITSRYEMGQSTQAERIGIELQHRQANIEYMALKDQGKVSCAKFEDLVRDRKYDETLLNESELPADFSEAILSQLGHKSLDFIRADNDVRVTNAQSETAFWKIAPELTFSYWRNYYNNVKASPIVPTQWTTTWMVSIELPILFPFYERSDYLKESALTRIAAQRASMRKIDSEKSIEISVKAFNRNKKVYEKLIAHDLPMAEAMVESTLAAYRQGKLGFSELVLAKRTWLDLKKEAVNLKLSMLNSRLICLNDCERN